MSHLPIQRLRDLTLIALACLPAAWACEAIGAPVPWLLGPLLASTLLAIITRSPWVVPKSAMSAAQVVVGLAIGLGFPPQAFAVVGSHLPALSLLVGVTAGLSLCNGFLLWRMAGVDRATGFLGSIPGAASSMVVMGADLGADTRVVAVLQYLRVLLVAVLAPMAIQLLVPHLPGDEMTAVGAAAATPPLEAWHFALIACYGLAGVGLARGVKLPAGYFLGPCLIAVVGTVVSGVAIPFPQWLFSSALVVVGAWIGVQFDWPLLRRLSRIALVQCALVIALIAAAAVLGWVFSLLTGVPLITAFLGSTPGAMEAMVAVSIQLGADPPFVMAMQMTRFLLLLFTGPWIARYLVHRVAKAPARSG